MNVTVILVGLGMLVALGALIGAADGRAQSQAWRKVADARYANWADGNDNPQSNKPATRSTPNSCSSLRRATAESAVYSATEVDQPARRCPDTCGWARSRGLVGPAPHYLAALEGEAR